MLALAVELDFRGVSMETDCLQLFQAWRRGVAGLSYLDFVIRDCRLLVSAFELYSFTFVRRLDNSVANFLARNANTYVDSVWVERVSPTAILFMDLNVMTSLPIGS